MKALRKLYFGLNAVSNVICTVFEVIAVLLVVVNAADVFLQVFNRYVLVKISNVSISWTEELARYSMIWICYCVLGICFREGSMAQVDIIYGKLGRKGRLVLYVATRLLMVMVLFVAIKYPSLTKAPIRAGIVEIFGITLFTLRIAATISLFVTTIVLLTFPEAYSVEEPQVASAVIDPERFQI